MAYPLKSVAEAMSRSSLGCCDAPKFVTQWAQ